MRGKSHIITGVSTAAVLADSGLLLSACPEDSMVYQLSSGFLHIITDTAMPMWLYVSAGILLYLTGVLLPDIDSPYSTLGRKLYIPLGHRSWLHSIWLVLVFAIGSIWVRVLWFLAFGIFVHLFFDSFSRSGIRWFYPFKGHHRIKLYRTSSVSEYVCVGIVVAMAILYSGFTLLHLYPVFSI